MNTKNRFRWSRVVVALVVVSGAAAVARPNAMAHAGLDFWNLSSLNREIEEDTAAGEEIDSASVATLRRIAIKDEIVRDLIDGDIDLLRAALVPHLNARTPNTWSAALQYPGRTDEVHLPQRDRVHGRSGRGTPGQGQDPETTGSGIRPVPPESNSSSGVIWPFAAWRPCLAASGFAASPCNPALSRGSHRTTFILHSFFTPSINPHRTWPSKAKARLPRKPARCLLMFRAVQRDTRRAALPS